MSPDARLRHTLDVMAWCAAVVARVSAAAGEELCRHLATLRLAADVSEMPTPDLPGVQREHPAHQGSLPALALDRADPVNPCPGVASASAEAADIEGKAADPAPAAISRRASRDWVDGRAPLSAATIEEMRRLWDAGTRRAEIAARLGVAAKSVSNYATNRGWPRRETVASDGVRPPDHSGVGRGSTPRISPAQREEAERRWRAGEGPTAIAAAVGLATKTIKNLAYKHGWPRELRRRTAEPSVAERELAEQAAEAESAPADYGTIRAWGRAHGVDMSVQNPATVIARVNAVRTAHALPPFRPAPRA